jgi:hypothetical protein
VESAHLGVQCQVIGWRSKAAQRAARSTDMRGLCMPATCSSCPPAALQQPACSLAFAGCPLAPVVEPLYCCDEMQGAA